MRKHISVVIISLLLCSCNNNNSVSPNNSAGTIWPFKKGSSWSVKFTTFDSSSKIIQINDDVWEFTSDTVISGEQWFVLGLKWSRLASREDGIYLWYYDSGSTPTIYLPYPSNVNSENKTSLWWVKTLSIDSTITIDGVKYRCYAYLRKRNPTEEYLSTEFFAPGLGPIRRDYYVTSAGGTKYMNMQLVYSKIK